MTAPGDQVRRRRSAEQEAMERQKFEPLVDPPIGERNELPELFDGDRRAIRALATCARQQGERVEEEGVRGDLARENERLGIVEVGRLGEGATGQPNV